MYCETCQLVVNLRISDKEDVATLEALWNVIHKRCSIAAVSTVINIQGNVSPFYCIDQLVPLLVLMYIQMSNMSFTGGM